MPTLGWRSVAGVALALAACGGEPSSDLDPPAGSLLADPLAQFPAAFADVGLYPRAPDLEAVPDVAWSYAPAWPLWSNGSDKTRFIALPQGQRVAGTDGSTWSFPPGTLFFKTFAYAGRPVETRILRADVGGGWDYAAYLWNDGGDAATLLDLELETAVPQEGFDHTIPDRLGCRECHESAPSPVLGLSEVQVGTDLPRLAALGAFASPIPDDPRQVSAADERTRRVLGNFTGNCVPCHNGLDGPSSSFDLNFEVALDNIIDRETQSSASAAGIRVVPGDPAQSILFAAYSGETDDPEVKDMPPLAIDRRDTQGIEELRTWIAELP